MSRGRKKRQYYTGEQKVAILKRHLVEREEVSTICEELKLHPTVFYEWQRRFFENGVKAFESEERQESKQLRDKVEALEAKLKRKDSAMAELVEELIAEKKKWGRLMKRWVEPQTRDPVVDFVHHWEERTSLQRGLFLRHLGLRRNRFNSWESRYGLENFHNGKIHRDFWLEEWEKEKISEYYRVHATEGYRAVAYRMMDEDVVAVAPSTVYRVLKSQGFFTRWNERPDSLKGSGFQRPPKPHDHWHVDISCLNFCGTFYYFMAVLDGCSRYIAHWDIRESMTERDVELVIQRARELLPDAKPRIISDNGPQFVSRDFKEVIRVSGMSHVRTSPYYSQASGKFERFNRTIKTECIRPKAPISMADAKRMVTDFIEMYNYKRVHSSLGFVAPYDRLVGRHEEIFQARDAKLAAVRARRKAV